MSFGISQLLKESSEDPSFIDEVLKYPAVARNGELVDLLVQGKEKGFGKSLLNYMFLDHEDIVKEAIKNTYHPVLIKYIKKYTSSQGFDHRNIANHIFGDKEYFYDFFSPYREISLDISQREELTKGFGDGSLLMGASFVYSSEDNLYMLFSTIKKNPVEDGQMTINYLNKGFSRVEWKGLESISSYLTERFPEKNIFDILNLDPEKIL